jgi:NADH-quinone oxidoreductase subunit C
VPPETDTDTAPAAAPSLAGPLGDLADDLRDHLGDALLEATDMHGMLVIRVPADKRPQALATLKVLGFDYYSFCNGVDWPDDERFEVFDHVESMTTHIQVTVKCEVPRSNPRVPTAVPVYGGADWHERETWELFGIVFTGHPRLRRLLLADWQEGFPMRKDEVLRARIEKPWPGEFFSG